MSVDANGGSVDARINGDGPEPPFDELLAELRTQAGSVTITVTAYPATTTGRS